MRAHLIWKNNSKFLAVGFAIRHKEYDESFFDQKRRRQKVILAILLSILLHMFVLWVMQRLPKDLSQSSDAGTRPLTVSLENASSRPQQRQDTAAVQPAATPPPAPERPVKPTPRTSRPVITMNGPATVQRPTVVPLDQTPLPAPAPQPSNLPPQEDMMSHVNARREQRASEEAHERALEANGGVGESDADRAKRIALANIAATGGAEQDHHTGGIFEITDKQLHNATFTFHGWNKDFKRNFGQQIDVQQGSAPTIELAIVDRMIDIIRQYEKNNFQWDSHRLGKTVTLSARKDDQAGLENFLMQEFDFDGTAARGGPPPPPRRRGG